MERNPLDRVAESAAELAPRNKRFRLVTLGRMALLDTTVEEPTLATRPRKLAVLAWLALRPGQRATRDRIIGVFWGERDEERARNSLSDAVSHLRRVLGRNAIRSLANELIVDTESTLGVDALELTAAANSCEHQQVTALYTGPFLDGVYVDDAPEFDDWRDRSRARFAAIFARSAAVRCTELARARSWDACRELAERWLGAEPASADAALFYLNSIKAPGTAEARAAAIAAYGTLVRRLEHEVGATPHPDVTALAQSISAQLASDPSPPGVNPATMIGTPPAGTMQAGPVDGASLPNGEPATAAASSSTAVRAPAPGHSALLRRAAYLTCAAVMLGAVVLGALRSPESAIRERRVVVPAFENRTGDSTRAALGRVAADWITRGLIETRRVEVIDAVAAPAPANAPIDPRILGREARADLVVIGSYFERDDSIEFEARVVDAHSGRVLRAIQPASGARANPIGAVEQLRQRVAGALAAEVDPVIAGLARESSQPPDYAAYLAWVQGLDAFSHHDLAGSIRYFEQAASADSAFVAPRLWAAAAYGNLGEWARCDSIIRGISAKRATLAPLDRGLLDVWTAQIRGDNAAGYTAAHEMLAAAPRSELALFIAGLSAVEVNRPNEAVELLRQIPTERSGVAWDLYGTSLPQALHLAGRFEKELAEARRRRSRQPALIATIANEARALVALGRIDEAKQLMTDAASLPGQAGQNVGQLMYATALEMRVHGHPVEARAVFERVADWARARPSAELATRENRSLLGRALYQAGRWRDADSIFRALSRAQPGSAIYLGWVGLNSAQSGDTVGAARASAALASLGGPYLHGMNTLARARIAAVLGRREDAVSLARQARAEGAEIEQLHVDPEFLALHGYAPFDELVRPTG
jgi:DNA-binding SARP family transcriptional activator/TolB-like protein/tetratricopeptide (TPR) repeat protein